METIKYINYFLATLFLVCYSYQMFYILVPFIFKDKPHKKDVVQHRFAVLIAARDEALVIGQLINSIKAQTYDGNLITIFVIADNCTDDTAKIAEEAGAVVYKRFNKNQVGKGYAVQFLLDRIEENYPEHPFDAFFVFDADNVVDKHFIEEMNKTYSDGYDIITCYRNSKNYGDNWISAGCGLWFLRESRYLNHARMLLNTSCAVSGTGFMFTKKVLDACGGWNFFLLTEDIEFTAHNICDGRRIGYCKDAIIFDEQPTKLKPSWNQRLRWARGYFQVFARYGKRLMRGALRGNFSCYDMSMAIMPATFISAFGIFINLYAVIFSLIFKQNVGLLAVSATALAMNMYVSIFCIGLLTTITEWNNIYTSTWKKIFYIFTFPLFMFTFIPIMFAAVFTKKVTWTRVEHEKSVDVAQIKGSGKKRFLKDNAA